MRRTLALAPLAAAVLTFTALPRDAAAAAPWVERRLTLPTHDWAFDLGFGFGHVPGGNGINGAGLNLEMAVSLIQHLELGVRTGLRFGDANERGVEADRYARLFERQYGEFGNAVFANPEVRLRWAFVEGDVAGVGLEGRVVLPLENGTNATFVPGLPLALHLGDRVRLDTGAWLSVITGPPRAVASLHFPLDLWIQATSRLWLGPETGLTAYDLGGNQATTYLLLGFGLGYQISKIVDFKTQLRFNQIDRTGNDWGLGAGVQIRIE